MIKISDAIKFHGHLGPWLVLGLIMGEYGLKKVSAKKYFGLKATVNLPFRKPVSCLIDGLQLSTGCTLGKDNIRVKNSKEIKVRLMNKRNNKTILLEINKDVLNKLFSLKTHRDSELFAERIYKSKPNQLFKTSEGVK